MSVADKFPDSLPAFQRMFPDDAACARYLEAIRWRSGFACPRCADQAEPFRFAARPGVLRCRAFTFRFNRRFYPFNAFRSLLGLAVEAEAPTYEELYDGDWQHPGLKSGK